MFLRLLKRAYYVKKFKEPSDGAEYRVDKKGYVFLQWSAHGGSEEAAKVACELAGWPAPLAVEAT